MGVWLPDETRLQFLRSERFYLVIFGYLEHGGVLKAIDIVNFG